MKKVIFSVLLLSLLLCLGVSASAEDVLLMEDGCETEREGAELLSGSVDGTKFYRVSGCALGYLPYETSSDFLYELDIRFNNEGCGFSFVKKGKWNSCIRIKDGFLALQTGGNSFSKLCEVDLTKWYHFTFLGRTNKDANQVTYGHIVLEEYDESGKRINRQVFKNVNLRNNAATHYIDAYGGCDIDNLKAFTPVPTKILVTSDSDSIVSGESVQINTQAMWNDLTMHGVNTSDITFEVFDGENKYPLDDETVAIDLHGKLTTEPLTKSQTVTVRVSSKAAGVCEIKKVNIVSGDIFTVTAIGMSEEMDRITRIKAVKNFAAYKDTVSFVVAFYSDNGFVGADFKALSASDLEEGENEISVSIPLPEGFSLETGRISVFVITSLTGSDKDILVEAKKEELPEFDELVTVITLREGCDASKFEKEDILYFDVCAKDEVIVPEVGDTYIFGSVEKIDCLVKVVNDK